MIVLNGGAGVSRLERINQLRLDGWQTHYIGCPWIVMRKPCLDDYGAPDFDYLSIWPDGRVTEGDIAHEAE